MPKHPGAILYRDFMKPLQMSSYKLAKAIEVSIPTVNEIVRERRAITAQIAVRLARYFGTTPIFWQNLQGEYDLKIARRRLGTHALKRIVRLSKQDRTLLGLFPEKRGKAR
jgi:addiction module HigA family antidote